MSTDGRGGFPADVFDDLAALEPGHFWFESRNRLIVWALRRYFPDARTFLEAGCGTGFVLQGIHAAFPDLALTAVDAERGGLAIARGRVPTAVFVQQDLREFDAQDTFDVVGAFDVLEHVPQDDAVLSRLRRAIRPGGGMMVTVPQHPWLWSRSDDIAHHVRRYRRADLTAGLRAAGLEIVWMTSFVSLPLPALAVSRWLDSRRTTPHDYGDLKVSHPVNTMLSGVLTVERAMIRAGVSWPAGGSLFAVARRPEAA